MNPVIDALNILYGRTGRTTNAKVATVAKKSSGSGVGGYTTNNSGIGGYTINPNQFAGPTSSPFKAQPVLKARVLYISEKRRWKRSTTIRVDASQTITNRWTGCCVCKATSSADLHWWNPVYVVRVELLGVSKESGGSAEYYKYFPYKPFNSKNYVSYSDPYKWPRFDFGVCSKPCLSMFYLSMLDAPLEGK